MSRYLILCRMGWPVFLVLAGVIALIDQTGVLSWQRTWPVLLIVQGILMMIPRLRYPQGGCS